jgi:hypothetical protein
MAEELLMNELDAKSKTLNEYKEKIDDLRVRVLPIYPLCPNAHDTLVCNSNVCHSAWPPCPHLPLKLRAGRVSTGDVAGCALLCRCILLDGLVLSPYQSTSWNTLPRKHNPGRRTYTPRAPNRKPKALNPRDSQAQMENMDILSQLQTKERDSMEVIKYLRKENEELQEKLRKYKEEADEAREVAERTMRTAGEERDRAISEIETKFKTNDEVREAEVRKLREDLFSLKTFKDRKEVLEAELESVHQELFDAQTAHKEAMSGVERKLIEEKTRLQKEAHAQLMEIKRNTDEEVVNRLDVSTKRILQQNRRLAEDLKLHVQETADLQRIKATLEAENLKMKRDMSLNKEQVTPRP